MLRQGRRLEGPLFQLVATENDRGFHRLGLTVSRRVGPAAARNRAKRLLRESFRRLAVDGERSFDLVVVAKAGLVGCSQDEVDREYQERSRRLLGGRGAGGPRPPAGR